MVERDLAQAYLWPQDRVWVLRNLTTGQFVRSDQLQEPDSAAPAWGPTVPVEQVTVRPSKPGGFSGTFLYKKWKRMVRRQQKKKTPAQQPPLDRHQPLTLANIFLVLTCSSRKRLYTDIIYLPPARKREEFLQWNHGPWAGCAFDVVRLSEHAHSDTVSHPPWTNVSREVVADILNLCYCIRKGQEMWGHWRALVTPPLYPDRNAAWVRYWDGVKRTRRMHHAWVKESVQRPWVYESMYEPDDESENKGCDTAAGHRVAEVAPRLELVL
jgi:hypothetical protein